MSKKKLLSISLGCIVLFGASVGALLLFNNPVSDALKNAIGVEQGVPTFAFNEEVASGWWAGDNHNARSSVTDDYAREEPVEKLPVAGRVIMQSRDTTVDSCFVMYSYYDYRADTDALLREKEKDATSSTDLLYSKLPSQNLTIDTPGGVKSYELHQYAISGPGSKQVQRGMSYGYIELTDGYIAVSGVCPEGDQLTSTSLGMRAISLIK